MRFLKIRGDKAVKFGVIFVEFKEERNRKSRYGGLEEKVGI